jgi:hypothetical protein
MIEFIAISIDVALLLHHEGPCVLTARRQSFNESFIGHYALLSRSRRVFGAIGQFSQIRYVGAIAERFRDFWKD